MTKVYLGKIVNTHGIKGELKLLSDFEYLSKVLVPNFKLYINDTEYTLTSFRFHQKFCLITLNSFTNINEVLALKGLDVYINKEDLKLKEDEYLLSDLINASVYEEKYVGKVKEVLLGKPYNYIRVINTTTNFLVPLIPRYIIKFDSNKKILYTKDITDLDLKKGEL